MPGLSLVTRDQVVKMKDQVSAFMELLYNEGNKQVYRYIREFQIEMSAEENYSTDMWERLTRRGPFEGLFKQGDIRAETDESVL